MVRGMNSTEKIRENVATLKESIDRDWKDLVTATTVEERVGIRTHLQWCINELTWLVDELAKADRAPDTSQRAKSIVDIATGGDTTPEDEQAKNPAAVALGRRGGLKGGKARAAKMTPEEREEAARLAAQARWRKKS